MKETFRNIYVHFPFCEAKCHYCDFFSLPEQQLGEETRSNVYAAIEKELKSFSDKIVGPLETVFFGGGTPSLVPLETIESFIGLLPLGADTEFTMEANPSSITLERARRWRASGVNRISMGTQALDNERLLWLGRVHTKEEVLESLNVLFEAGFKNISTDYIVGVPGQTPQKIETEVTELLSRYPNIRHISAYLLTLKPSNPKFKQLPDDEEQLLHLRTVSQVLGSHGFEHYEISNFAKPNSRAQHNENYWLGGSYLGIGPSAHSFWPSLNRRTKNWASLGKYVELIDMEKSAVEWEEALTLEQLRLEYLMLRLRRSSGLNIAEYNEKFGHDLMNEKGAWIRTWAEKGLCTLVPERLQLTSEGFFLSDQILSQIS